MKSGQAVALVSADASRVLRTVEGGAEVGLAAAAAEAFGADAAGDVAGAREHAVAAVFTRVVGQTRVHVSGLKKTRNET